MKSCISGNRGPILIETVANTSSQFQRDILPMPKSKHFSFASYLVIDRLEG